MVMVPLPFLNAREKDAVQYGAGLIVNVPMPEAEVTQAVEEVTKTSTSQVRRPLLLHACSLRGRMVAKSSTRCAPMRSIRVISKMAGMWERWPYAT